jgi:hypothetical protein
MQIIAATNLTFTAKTVGWRGWDALNEKGKGPEQSIPPEDVFTGLAGMAFFFPILI